MQGPEFGFKLRQPQKRVAELNPNWNVIMCITIIKFNLAFSYSHKLVILIRIMFEK